MQVFRPAAAAVGEVLAVGNQALVQVAGEQRDAVRAGVVSEEMAGHADLAAAAFSEHVLIQPGPIFDLLVAGGLQTGEGDRHHGDSCGRTPVLAADAGRCRISHHLHPAWLLPDCPETGVPGGAPPGAPAASAPSRGDWAARGQTAPPGVHQDRWARDLAGNGALAWRAEFCPQTA